MYMCVHAFGCRPIFACSCVCTCSCVYVNVYMYIRVETGSGHPGYVFSKSSRSDLVSKISESDPDSTLDPVH